MTDQIQQTLLKTLKAQKKQLIESLRKLNTEIKHVEQTIVDNCSHTKIVHYILPGFERAEHNFCCKMCKTDLSHTVFDRKNIVKTIEY